MLGIERHCPYPTSSGQCPAVVGAFIGWPRYGSRAWEECGQFTAMVRAGDLGKLVSRLDMGRMRGCLPGFYYWDWRQSTSAKEATALERLKARLGAVKTETGAEIAELAGKVNRLQSEVTTKLPKGRERFDRRDHRGAVPARWRYESPAQ